MSEMEIFQGGGLAVGQFTLTQTGIDLTGATEQDWGQIGFGLKRAEDALGGWALGDWYLYGEQHFPEQLKTIADAADLRVWRQKSRVAKAFPREFRAQYQHERALSFGHFETVAKLGPEQATYWLDKAVEEQLGDNVTAFRKMVKQGAAGTDDAPALPAITEADSQPGYIYQLGPHRLLVGDSTDPFMVAALLGWTWDANGAPLTEGERASMIWTDPPYGVDYVGKTADALTIENDAAKGDALLGMLVGAWKAAENFCVESAPFYVAGPSGENSLEFMQSFRTAGWRFKQHLVWDKDTWDAENEVLVNGMVMGHQDHHYAHESVFYGYTPGRLAGRHQFASTVHGKDPGLLRWHGGDNATTVFHIKRPSVSKEHPTMKPVDLIKAQLLNSSLPGDIVLDQFAGSGSTMIAADLCGRRAFLIELDPRYADVIRNRWAKHEASKAAAGATS